MRHHCKRTPLRRTAATLVTPAALAPAGLGGSPASLASTPPTAAGASFRIT